MKAGIISLGCAKNLVDTEVMLGILQEGGIELTTDPGEADILVVNTDRKSTRLNSSHGS